MSGREEGLGSMPGYVYVERSKATARTSLYVHTPDTQVTVHGTSFSVEVSGPRSGPSAQR